MAGPLGLAGAIAGMRLVVCPHCDRRQMRARGVSGAITCKFCYQRFEAPPPGKPPARRSKR